MNDECFAWVFGACIGILIGGLIVSGGWSLDAKAFKTNAVKYGAAEWRTDESGNTTFHWKERR